MNAVITFQSIIQVWTEVQMPVTGELLVCKRERHVAITIMSICCGCSFSWLQLAITTNHFLWKKNCIIALLEYIDVYNGIVQIQIQIQLYMIKHFIIMPDFN